MKIAFYTLGCKVNQYETQALEQLVTQRGHSLVPFEEAADAYVVNSCSVSTAYMASATALGTGVVAAWSR